MSKQITTKTGTDLFNTYLNKFKDEVRETASDKYYHVDVVAEAYNQGFSDGEKSGKKEYVSEIIKNRIEELTQKANQVYILAYRVISHIRSNNFRVNSFYINIFHTNPQVIIAVDDKLLLDDTFVESTYLKIFEMKRIFNDLFKVTLDMGLIGSDDLDIEALTEDGYEYSEDLTLNE